MAVGRDVQDILDYTRRRRALLGQQATRENRAADVLAAGTDRMAQGRRRYLLGTRTGAETAGELEGYRAAPAPAGLAADWADVWPFMPREQRQEIRTTGTVTAPGSFGAPPSELSRRAYRVMPFAARRGALAAGPQPESEVGATPWQPELMKGIAGESLRRRALLRTPETPEAPFASAGRITMGAGEAPGPEHAYIGVGPTAAPTYAPSMTDFYTENRRRINMGQRPLSLDEFRLTRAETGALEAEAGGRQAAALAAAPLAPRMAEAQVGGAEAATSLAKAQAELAGLVTSGVQSLPAEALGRMVFGIPTGQEAALGMFDQVGTLMTAAQAAREGGDEQSAQVLSAIAGALGRGAAGQLGIEIPTPEPGFFGRIWQWVRLANPVLDLLQQSPAQVFGQRRGAELTDQQERELYDRLKGKYGQG